MEERTEPKRGALDLAACPTRWRGKGRCRCEPCAACGYPKHHYVHGPDFGQPPGSEPWNHQYVPPYEGA